MHGVRMGERKRGPAAAILPIHTVRSCQSADGTYRLKRYPAERWPRIPSIIFISPPFQVVCTVFVLGFEFMCHGYLDAFMLH